jgi:hypothetical protein
MSTTDGQLILADFTADNITMTSGQTYYLIAYAGTGSVMWNKSGDGDLSPATFYNTNGAGAAGWTNNQGYKDVGYLVQTVPEPSVYAFGFGAVAMISAAYWRRRQGRRIG